METNASTIGWLRAVLPIASENPNLLSRTWING